MFTTYMVCEVKLVMAQAPVLPAQISNVSVWDRTIDALHATPLRCKLLGFNGSLVNKMEDTVPVSLKLHGTDSQQE